MIPAAQYIRMSTEHQQYSLFNQSTAIQEYAIRKGFTVVRTYSDAAKSGLRLRNRPGLRQLLADTLARNRSYQAILVYDISRWGRFQDTDESAYYEFMCKSSGVRVYYCTESFEDDGSMASSLLKTLKRSMAAEFSRELGAKELQGKKIIAARGFFVGGRVPYGFRRKILSSNESRCLVLQPGERKHLRTERLTLVHGPEEEFNCVGEIFHKFVDDRMSPRAIAKHLNSTNVLMRGKRWTKLMIDAIILNPTYAGHARWGRSSQRLGQARVEVEKDQWVVARNAFDGIVSQATFDRAQKFWRPDPGRTVWTKDQIIKVATRLVAAKGRLTAKVFDQCPDAPSSSTVHRFCFSEIYKAAGYTPPPGHISRATSCKQTRQLHRNFLLDLVSRFPDNLSMISGGRPNLLLDRSIVVSLLLCRSISLDSGLQRWRVTPPFTETSNITLVGLLNASNSAVEKVILLPEICSKKSVQFHERHSWLAGGVPLGDFSNLCDLIRRLFADKMQVIADQLI